MIIKPNRHNSTHSANFNMDYVCFGLFVLVILFGNYKLFYLFAEAAEAQLTG